MRLYYEIQRIPRLWSAALDLASALLRANNRLKPQRYLVFNPVSIPLASPFLRGTKEGFQFPPDPTQAPGDRALIVRQQTRTTFNVFVDTNGPSPVSLRDRSMWGVLHKLAICCKIDSGEITLIKFVVTTEVLKILHRGYQTILWWVINRTRFKIINH